MVKILFLNVTGSTNKGDMAFVIGHINCIRQHLSDAEMTILSIDTNVDKIFENYGVKVIPHRWYKRERSKLLSAVYALIYVTRDVFSRLFCGIIRIFDNKYLHFYNTYDLVIDPHADGFNEPYYGFWETLYFSINLLLAQLIIRKPIIIGPASVGPITSKFNKWLARFLLNNVEVITLRERVSLSYINQELLLNKPKVFLIDDLAFLIEPSFSERVTHILEKTKGDIPNKRPLLAINPSRGMMEWNRPQNYTMLMANIIDYLVDKLNARILLIPQAGNAGPEKQVIIASDSVACSKVYSQVQNKDAVSFVPNEITPEEWKAVIGSCDLSIGCRLHCAIMSTSMCVPTVTLPYGRKVNALIGGMMGQDKALVSVQNSDFPHALSELISITDYVWENREKIKEDLRERNTIVRQRALTYGGLVKQLLKIQGMPS